jgi:hypothetical protein
LVIFVLNGKNYGGSFDKSMYHIDHIVELQHGGTNHHSNLQALCPQCHAVKTNFEKGNKVENPHQRKVSEKIKKQIAARQYFRCANVNSLYRNKQYVVGSLIGGFAYSLYSDLKSIIQK